MNPYEDPLKYKISVMEAAKAGKEIECRYKYAHEDGPYTAIFTPAWNWEHVHYRVKPEKLILWVNVYPKEGYSIHETKEEADKNAATGRIRCVKVIETTEE